MASIFFLGQNGTLKAYVQNIDRSIPATITGYWYVRYNDLDDGSWYCFDANLVDWVEEGSFVSNDVANFGYYDSDTGIFEVPFTFSADLFEDKEHYTFGLLLSSPNFNCAGEFIVLSDKIGIPVALDGGSATIAGMLTKIVDDNDGGDFDATTDSLDAMATAISNIDVVIDYAAIADAVWDEDAADHVASGSIGEALRTVTERAR